MPSVFDLFRLITSDALQSAWDRLGTFAAIRQDNARARRFARFGEGSAICFPMAALFGEEHIELGSGCIIGPYCSLSAGIMPGATGGRTPRLEIGDRCLIGKGSGIVTHELIELGDDVFTGHHLYITDSSHGYEDVTLPIGKQFGDVDPVHIGAGTWLGHGTVVLPGSSIGRHVVIGANSVVNGTIPDFSVAVGSPAQVIRRYTELEGWHRVHEQRAHVDHHRAAIVTQAGDGYVGGASEGGSDVSTVTDVASS
jgi:acetyltransferase-like isoleucine patch superfamily enzyme